MSRLYLRSLATASALVCALAGGIMGHGTAGATSFPVSTDAIRAYATGIQFAPSVAPPGANRPGCVSASGRDPVILVHGTGLNQFANWQYLAPTLANNGFCVFSFTYGMTQYSGNSGGIGSMYRSADQLDAVVDDVLAATGAKRVDLVGHSQGGAVQRIYASVPSRAAKVDTMIGLAAANSGPPTVSGLKNILDSLPALRDSAVFRLCPACSELDKPATYPPPTSSVRYVNIIGLTDEVITPYTRGLLPPAGNVINETVQSVCPASRVGHLGIVYDPAVGAMVLNALDPQHKRSIECDVGLSV